MGMETRRITSSLLESGSGNSAKRRRIPDRLANPGGTGETWFMDRRMSDNELRRAIRVLRDRADEARSHGRPEDADGIEKTIRDYQDEMAQRL